ncbi:MAG: tRNA (adenosine(37)-N6)-threonylcarbamoyltransferase complex ATPase subunit type 1 TsaE [Candidatus Eremiobacteraeota bacterium]|nr:tRNA (adenosine(37)-N6)-threonylcarbamoyltransferase complex ATPase subunit type 1 TsaE [Candidatus Eremiobacteraeota bacterium]
MERTFQREADLRAFAAEFTRSLRPGDVVGLSGALGAGKTTFVRAAVNALHGTDPTTSPTFTFWHRYPAPQTGPGALASAVDHLDLYRIDDPAELAELGLEEVFDDSSIVFVEWWENAPILLPLRRYEITLEGMGDGPRRLRMTAPQ